MASLQKKIIRGHPYWYLVQSRRVNGKPRPVVLAYLGKPDDLWKRLQQIPPTGLRVRSWAHGGVAALSALASRLGAVQIIDRQVRRAHRRTPSVGTTLLLAALNRALEPRSKRGWVRWGQRTTVDRLFGVDPSRLTSQFFWDQMHEVSEKALVSIEEELTRRLVKDWGVSLDTIFYDTTNFFTYIATTNRRPKLPQRGRSKQRRTDLRQFGLALLVSKTAGLPLCSEVYAGNRVDSKVFPESLTAIRHRLERVVGSLEGVTVVYDKGNNSQENQAEVDQSQMHYVASLVPTHFPKLLEIAESKFEPVEIRTGKLLAYRLRQTVWDRERTLVVLVSERLRQAQLRGLRQHVSKAERALKQWKEELAKPRSGPRDEASARRRMQQIVRAQHLKRVVEVHYDSKRRGEDRLNWKVREEVIEDLVRRLFGKRILMTDREDWETGQIVEAYCGQSHYVEGAFRQLKDVDHLAVRPQYHWTDQKIRVHVFWCLLAYTLSGLMEMEARRQGFRGERSALLDDLDRVRWSLVVAGRGPKAGWRTSEQLEEVDQGARRLYRLFVPEGKDLLGYTPSGR